MRSAATILAVLAITAMLASCGGSPTASNTSTPSKPNANQSTSTAPKDVTPPAKMPASAMPTEPPSETPVSAPKPAAAANSLEGTTWQIGPYKLTFKKEPEVLIKGGDADNVSPDGITGEYHLKGTSIEVGANGEIHTGTYDGKTMNIEGQDGTKVETPPAGAVTPVSAPAAPSASPAPATPATAAPAAPAPEPAPAPKAQ